MMGFAVPTLDYPVLKNNNAILAFSAEKTAEAEAPGNPLHPLRTLRQRLPAGSDARRHREGL